MATYAPLDHFDSFDHEVVGDVDQLCDGDHHETSRDNWALRSIRWYQRGVEGRPSPCRFTPSCSSYALEAVEGHGIVPGLFLAARRLLRCRPFGPSGFDPVPDPRTPDRKLAD